MSDDKNRPVSLKLLRASAALCWSRGDRSASADLITAAHEIEALRNASSALLSCLEPVTHSAAGHEAEQALRDLLPEIAS